MKKNQRKARKMKSNASYFCTVHHLGDKHYSRLFMFPAALTPSVWHANPSPRPLPSPPCPTGKKLDSQENFGGFLFVCVVMPARPAGF